MFRSISCSWCLLSISPAPTAERTEMFTVLIASWLCRVLSPSVPRSPRLVIWGNLEERKKEKTLGLGKRKRQGGVLPPTFCPPAYLILPSACLTLALLPSHLFTHLPSLRFPWFVLFLWHKFPMEGLDRWVKASGMWEAPNFSLALPACPTTPGRIPQRRYFMREKVVQFSFWILRDMNSVPKAFWRPQGTGKVVNLVGTWKVSEEWERGTHSELLKDFDSGSGIASWRLNTGLA